MTVDEFITYLQSLNMGSRAIVTLGPAEDQLCPPCLQPVEICRDICDAGAPVGHYATWRFEGCPPSDCTVKAAQLTLKAVVIRPNPGSVWIGAGAYPLSLATVAAGGFDLKESVGNRNTFGYELQLEGGGMLYQTREHNRVIVHHIGVADEVTNTYFFTDAELIEINAALGTTDRGSDAGLKLRFAGAARRILAGAKE